MKPIRIAGEPSFRVETESITFAVTVAGGQLGPVIFDLGGRAVQPFHVAPWAGTGEANDQPAILRALRGDFFCMPFGGNATEFEGEAHPVHGDTANADWTFESFEGNELVLSLETAIRPARIEKRIAVREGHSAIYQTHRIAGLAGPMAYGHHAMLAFSDSEGSGLVSVSPFVSGQVFPGLFEDPSQGGYTSLLPGAMFDCLSRVPMADGAAADLSHYPARKGFEDLVMVCADPRSELAWSAVVLPSEGYLWLSLKDRRTLPSTVLWHSNRGRHYPPWNGRHENVLGIEEVCAYFHYGLAESAAPNPVSKSGIPTCRQFKPEEPFEVRTIMALHSVPHDAVHVSNVALEAGGALVTFSDGRQTTVPVDPGFLFP